MTFNGLESSQSQPYRGTPFVRQASTEAKKPWYMSGRNWACVGLAVAGLALIAISLMVAQHAGSLHSLEERMTLIKTTVGLFVIGSASLLLSVHVGLDT